jgi:hypothetical protein
MGTKFEFERLTAFGEVCPLCGKPDWCTRLRPHEDLSNLYYSCMRAGNVGFSQEVRTRFTSPINGNEYVVIGAKETSVIFQELSDWMAHNPGKRLKDGTTAPGQGSFSYKIPERREMTAVPEIPMRPAAELDERYRYFLKQLKLEEKHRKYLYAEGFSDDMIEKYQIRSVPENDAYRYNYRTYKSVNPSRKQIMQKVADAFGNTLAGVPGFHTKDDGVTWTFAGPGGMIIPVPDIYGRFIGMRIRVDNRWRDSEGHTISKEQYEKEKELAAKTGRPCTAKETGKYMWLSSTGKKNGRGSGSPLGYYYPTSSGNPYAQKMVYITEGEKKSIVSSERLGLMCIDVPGVGNWTNLFKADEETGIRPVDILKKSGIRLAVVAYDADKEKNKMVLSHQDQLVKKLRDEGVIVGVAEWSMALGKGLDDYLVNGGGQPSIELIM